MAESPIVILTCQQRHRDHTHSPERLICVAEDEQGQDPGDIPNTQVCERAAREVERSSAPSPPCRSNPQKEILCATLSQRKHRRRYNMPTRQGAWTTARR